MNCKFCSGTGICSSCKGTGSGKKANTHPDTRFIDAKGNVRCTICNGKKICQGCGGTGKA